MKRGLLVDDHNLFRQVLAVVLEQHTDLKENLQAESLAEARQLLDNLEGKVDLAVVDLDLPEGDATELIESLRGLGVPVVAFTAGGSLERRARALEVGAKEVLSPATSGEEIIDVAKRLVDG
jgi:DNA-binding NarL/FixJ family response regulator